MIDLTQFGFTPTESLVYEALLTNGPGTGYALARAAGLARANAYSALEGLVAKGAARVEGVRPRHYRPEPPTSLIARISNDQGLALERLSADLETIAIPGTPTVVEIQSGRAVLQLHHPRRGPRPPLGGPSGPSGCISAPGPGTSSAGVRGAAGRALFHRPSRPRISPRLRSFRLRTTGRGCQSSRWWTIEAPSWDPGRGTKSGGTGVLPLPW